MQKTQLNRLISNQHQFFTGGPLSGVEPDAALGASLPPAAGILRSSAPSDH
jgi:hypothetical protein